MITSWPRIISDSAAGSVVHVTKTGVGKWILSGANTYSGDTTVEAGILSIESAFLDDDADVYLTTGGILDLNTSGAQDAIDALFIDDVAQVVGLWGAIGNALADYTTALITGSGLLDVGGTSTVPLAGAVPEPTTLMLSLMAALALAGRRRNEIA